MKLDDYDTVTTQTSTCVDDVFFVLKKTLKRSISTSEPDIVAATVRLILKTLDTGYLQIFQQRMSAAFSNHDPANRGSEKSPDQAKISYMVGKEKKSIQTLCLAHHFTSQITLNNLAMSVEYMQRLAQEAEPDVKDAVWKSEEDDTKAVSKALSDFDRAASKFQKLLQGGLEQLMGQIIKPRIRPLFQNAYREVKYVLEEDEYNEADVDELFVKRFRSGFDKLVEIYRRTLTDVNFGNLMSLILDAVTTQWERIIAQTRFNQYGALRFDKDLRSVIHYLSSLTDWLSRDRFTRLNQMSTLLNFEEVILLNVADAYG